MFLVALLAALETSTWGVQQSAFEIECLKKSNGSDVAIYDRGSCLIKKTTPKNFLDARKDCKDFGNRLKGHLVHVADQPRIDTMKDGFAMTVSETFHVGMMQKNGFGGPEYFWLYIDGGDNLWDSYLYPMKITSNLWKTGTPDEYMLSCGELTYESESVGVKLNDKLISNVNSMYICEYFDGKVLNYRQLGKMEKKGNGTSVINEEALPSEMHCARKCASVPVCFSYAYGKADQNCVLMYNAEEIIDAAAFEIQCLNKSSGSDVAIYDRGSCLIRKTTPKVFHDARKDCKDFGTQIKGHLAHIADQPRIDKIKSGFSMVVSEKFHIGMMQCAQFMLGPKFGWFFIDGADSLYDSCIYPAQITSNLWKPGQPNGWASQNTGKLTYESEVIGVKLEDDNTGSTAMYICEYFNRNVLNYRQLGKMEKKGNGTSVINEEALPSESHCSVKCASVPVCFSYAYGKADQNCVLMYNAEEIIDAAGYILFVRI